MNPQSGGMSLPGKSRSSLITTVILAVLLVAALAFGVWAFMGKQSSDSDVAKQVNTAVASAKTAEDSKLNAQFAEQLKAPYKTYTGPSTYGSISFSYPLSYSAYVDQTAAAEPINGYFYPKEVPGIQSNTSFALRVELLTATYSDTLDQYAGPIKDGKLKPAAYIPPKMKDVKNAQVGTLLTGVLSQDQAGNDQTGTLLIIAVRDKTLKLYSQSTDFSSDFNNIILPSLTFIP